MLILSERRNSNIAESCAMRRIILCCCKNLIKLVGLYVMISFLLFFFLLSITHIVLVCIQLIIQLYSSYLVALNILYVTYSFQDADYNYAIQNNSV